jgi:hypothetical protein
MSSYINKRVLGSILLLILIFTNYRRIMIILIYQELLKSI